jgi:hypothetical protein
LLLLQGPLAAVLPVWQLLLLVLPRPPLWLGQLLLLLLLLLLPAWLLLLRAGLQAADSC